MYDGWEKIEPLGSGGQSEVFKVRSPGRALQRRNCVNGMENALTFRAGTGESQAKMDMLATAVWTLARPDEDSELGALKVFKIGRSDDSDRGQEVKRLNNEIDVLGRGFPGLPKLLAHDANDCWIVTEYFRQGSFERQPEKYKGDPLLALKAFRSLVMTVKGLHEKGMVHRDIKPANVFIRNHDEMILGDFGIVFLPDTLDRPTATLERVGPRDYMAPWLDIGERVEEVTPCADVYMLGKLLWCMVSGRRKLSREYHRRDTFNLVKMFPNSPHMENINLDLSWDDEAKRLMVFINPSMSTWA